MVDIPDTCKNVTQVAVNLREARSEAVALINDCKRLISIWTRVHQEAVAVDNEERATRIAQLITECEMKLRQAEDRLQIVQGLIDSEERAKDAVSCSAPRHRAKD